MNKKSNSRPDFLIKRILPKSKRSQIPATLTWVVAFCVIFFIMLIFLVLSMTIFAKNNIPIVKYFKSSSSINIDYEKGLNELIVAKQLIYFLKTSDPAVEDIIGMKINSANNEYEYGGMKIRK